MESETTSQINTHDPVFARCDVTYIPMFLGGVMKACGNTPSIHMKNKDKWTSQERIRWARFFSIPMTQQIPASFPPLMLTIMRALCADTVLDPGSG
ncbi:hypothetical protein LSUB1_G001804 [Lachnellula subtilissima]|uniref:Uncharacterized protein n=1 Tax=Lachnellula subtilissima TaxID=602034 RepID=A0A8H8RVE5_9HELO|nr:hypothetical protein LSUB1_G001804 [Lachnellula subtilissima]